MKRVVFIAIALLLCLPFSVFAEYDSLEWVPLRSLALQPPDSKIHAVHKLGGYLYVGGDFTNIAGVGAKAIARWNGQTWQPVGEGFDGQFYTNGWVRGRGIVRALASDSQSNLYAGGEFGSSGGTWAWSIAKWNGTSWSALGAGNGFRARRTWGWNISHHQVVSALACDTNGTVYAGGFLMVAGGDGTWQDVGGIRVSNVASFSGGVWSSCGPGLGDWNWAHQTNARVKDLAMMADGRVVAAGIFTSGLATWKPGEAAWTALPGGALDGAAYTIWRDPATGLADSDGNLYVGGDFVTAGTTTVNRIARHTGGAWHAMGDGMSSGIVRSLARDAAGRIYAGGSFASAGGLAVNGLAQWLGSFWLPLGGGLSGGEVLDLGWDFTNRLVAVGDFTRSGSLPASGMAVFDRFWRSFGDGRTYGAKIHAILPDPSNGVVYVGGEFSSIGGVAANSIAVWNGRWSPLGSGIQNNDGTTVTCGVVNALALDDKGRLCVGGRFSQAGGRTANALAIYYKGKWGAAGDVGLASGCPGVAMGWNTVNSLKWDPVGKSFLVGGHFNSAGAGTYCFYKNICSFNPENNSLGDMYYYEGNSVEYGIGAPVGAIGICPSNNLPFVGGPWYLRALAYQWGSWHHYAAPTGTVVADNVVTIHFDAQGRLVFTTEGGPGIASSSWQQGTGSLGDIGYNTWSPLAGGLTNAAGDHVVRTYAYDPAGRLYAGGSFTHGGGRAVHKLAYLNGGNWAPIGSNTLTKDVRAIAFEPQGAFLVGGDFGYGWDATGSSDSNRWGDGIVMAVPLGPKLDVVGTNGAMVASGERVSVEKGTDFADVMPIGATRTRTLRLMNLGTELLVVSNTVLSGPAAANFSVAGVPAAVAFNTLSNFNVTFTPPSAPGVYEAALTIRSSAGADYVVNLRGSAGCRYIDATQNTPLGTITPDGHVPVFAGSNQAFTMFSTNNRLPHATVDGAYRGILYGHTYSNVTDNSHHLHVDFNIDTVVSDVVVTQRSRMSRDKYIDIRYTLADGDNSPNRIAVAISTNDGYNYTLIPASCSGDIGSGVMPGSKHIVWLAHQDWDGELCTGTLVRVVATDDNGAAEGESLPTELDTLFGIRPRILDIRGFDREGLKTHADFFNKTTAAIFLNDIGRLYGAGGEFEVPMRAEVDWRGTSEGNLEWCVNGRVARTGSASAEQAFSVSSDFGQGGRLEVQAVPNGAQRSARVRANFSVVGAPKLWTRFTAAAPSGGTKEYELLAPGITYSRKSNEKIPEKTSKGKDMPGGGNNKYDCPLTLDISGSVDLEGSGSIAATMSRGWEVKGFDVTPKTSGRVMFEYEVEATRWDYGGSFTVGLDVAKESEPRYITFKPPLYGKIGAHLGVDGTVYFDSNFNPEWGNSEILVTPGFWATAGFGVADVANVEGTVGLDLPNKFQISPFAYDLSLDLRAELTANLLFWSWAIWEEHWVTSVYSTGYRRKTGAEELEDLSRSIAEMRPALFHPVRRDYLYARDGGPEFENKTLGRDGLEVADRHLRKRTLSPGERELFIQTNNFAFSEPALDVLGTNRMILWVADAGTNRAFSNLGDLRWARWNGTAWQNSGSVWDDGTGDSRPQFKWLSGGRALAAWQNSGSVLSSGASLADGLESLEIAVARFDGTNWTALNLTTNQRADRAPQLGVATNGTALLTWQRNEGTFDPDTLIMQQVDSLYFSHYNGTNWSQPQPAALEAGLVLGAALAWNGRSGHLFVALDADRDITTDADQEIYSLAYSNGVWGALTRRTTNNLQDTRPQADYDSNGNLLVAWYQDGKVYSSTTPQLSSPVLVGNIQRTSAAQDFRLVTGPQGRMAIVWTDSVEAPFFRNPCLFNYDRDFNVWSQPVPLLNDSALERSYSGKLTTNGSIVLAYNKVETLIDDANVVTNLGDQVALVTLEYQFGRDLAVFAKDIVLDAADLTPGSNITGSVTFRNIGELALSWSWGIVYRGNPDAGGQAIASSLLGSGTLFPAGAVSVIPFTWTVPSNGTEQAIYARAFVSGQVDRDPANNTAFISPMRADYVVTRLSEEKLSADERLLHVAVRNGGLVTAPANTLALHLESTNGPVLAALPLEALATEATYTNSYLWNLSGTAFTGAFVRVVAVVDADGVVAELSEDNNVMIRRLSTNLDTDEDKLLDGEEARLGTDPAKADTDGDGLTDYDEATVHGSNPLDPDSDQDGLADGAEVARSTEWQNPDTDGDGFPDGAEAGKGTDPLDAGSFPSGMLKFVVRGQPEPYGIARPHGYGTNTYDSGAVVTSRVDQFVAVAGGERQTCTGWTGSGSVPATGGGTQVVFTISGDSAVTWIFAHQYELVLDTVSAETTPGAAGAVTGSAAGWHAAGTTVTLTAEPAADFVFAGWSGDVPAAMTNQNPLALDMNCARTLFARFVRRQYTLQVSSVRGSPRPGVGAHVYPAGDILSPAVDSPLLSGGIMYECTGWTLTGHSPVAGAESAFALVLTNNAALDWLWQTNALLTVSAGAGGSVSGAESGWHLLGSPIMLTATPDAHRRFVQWTGDVPPALMVTNPLSVAMSQPRTLRAVFVHPTSTVTVVASPSHGGSASGGGSYMAGSNVVLTAAPAAHWVFTGWNDGVTDAVRTVVAPMTSLTYTASFAPLIRTVTVQADPADGGTVTGGGSYQSGSSVTISATPFPNWVFTGWSDGVASRTRTFAMPPSNIVFTAGFLRNAPAYWYVSTNGSDGATGTNWATAKQTIQAAADLTRNGDVVVAGDGVYATGGRPAGGGVLTSRVAVTNAVTVRSLNGAARTVISGAAGVRGVYLADGAVLAGFTVTNGQTLAAGGADDRNGGGVRAAGSAVVSNCVIAGNSAAAAGGGAYGGRLDNCLLYGNSAAQGGGAFAAALANCTLTENTATEGGGVHSSTARNCIVYFNTAPAGENALAGALDYSCVTPAVAGTGNLTNEPGFLKFSRADYRLGVGSPCLDSGANAFAPGAQDLLGETRIQNATVDMGAYEGGRVIAYPQAGYAGAALVFDGVNDGLSAADAADLDFTGTFTLEAWIRIPDYSATRTIVSKQPSYALQELPGNYEFRVDQGSGKLTFGFEYGEAEGAYAFWTSAAGVPLNQFTHVAVVCRGGTSVQFFINGVPGTIHRMSLYPVANSQPVRVGRRSDGVFFRGEIDEVRLWNGARMPTELAVQQYQRLAGNESRLKAYWRMDEGTGGTVADSSGNGHTATLEGGTGFTRSDALVERAPASSTNAVVVTLGGFESNFPAAALSARITALPASGTLLQYGSLAEISAVPTDVADPDRRVVYQPPADTRAAVPFAYRVNDGDYDSANAATVTVDVATTVHVPLASPAGAALALDGTDDCIQVPHSSAFNLIERMTFEAWVRIDDYTQYGPVIVKSWDNLPGNFEMGIEQTSGKLRFGHKSNNRWCAWPDFRFFSSAGAVPTGAWTHVAVVFDLNSAVRFYINGLPSGGEIVYAADVCAKPIANTAPVLIGGRADGLRFKGQLDEVRVWNSARSDDEIVRNHDRRFAGPQDGLMAYWAMDDNSETFVTDETGYGNTGLLLNGPVFRLSAAPVDRAFVRTMDDVTLLLGGFKSNTAPDMLTATLLSLPAQGTLKQYGTLDPITAVPAVLTDGQRRLVYSPPPANAIYPITYRVGDGMQDSPNVATVRLVVATISAGRFVNVSNPAPEFPYTTWETAATNIQDAVDAATDGDLITVAPGTYDVGGGRKVAGADNPNRVYVNKPVVLRSLSGPAATVIRGDGMRGVYLVINSVLDGFTVTAGAAGSGAGATSDGLGGGVYCETGAVLTNCIIAGNTSDQRGGGVFGGTLYNCRVTGNSSVSGAGVSGNINIAVIPVLYNCYLSGNTAWQLGGAISDCTLHNCIVVGNHAGTYSAGGCWRGTLYNCTVVGNTCNNAGRAAGVDNSTLINSICYSNVNASGVANSDYSGFHYSCTTPHPGGNGNITNNPMFKDPAAGDYSLLDGSACLNSGDNSYATNYTADFGGNPRIQGDVVEMGALESSAILVSVTSSPPQGGYVTGAGSYTPGVAHIITATPAPLYDFAGWSDGSPGRYTTVTIPESAVTYTGLFVRPAYTFHVTTNGSDSADGTSWATAKRTIQAAIDAATTGDAVLVSNGVYNAGGKGAYGENTRVAIDKPISVRSLNGPAVTIIDGSGFRGAAVNNGASLDGFTVRNGTANNGGGVYCDMSGVVSNCLITGNNAGYGGGLRGGTARHCIISGNQSYPGAAGAQDSTLESCLVVRNTTRGCGQEGGAVVNCVLRNCVVAYNAYADICYNPATGCGGLLDCTVYNSIVAFNTDGNGTTNYSRSTFDHSCTMPAPGGTGNITSDPQFVNGASNDYRLAVGSPCRNAGDNANAAPLTDLLAMPRIEEGIVDMGAYECQTQALISVRASPPEGGSVSGGGYFAVGANADLSAAANPDWTFNGWSDGETAAVRTVVAAATNATYTADFLRHVSVQGLAVPEGGGTFTGEGIHVSGSNIQMQAVPEPGWIFVKWENGSTNSVLPLTVAYSDMVYQAHFALVTPPSGPRVGGNSVLITNGYFGIITNVLLGGTPVAIQAHGSNWVQVLVPAPAAVGTHDVLIQTFDNGDTRICNAYTVNPAGRIHGPLLPRPTRGNLDAGTSYSIALRHDATAVTWGGFDNARTFFGPGYDLGQLNVPPPNEGFVDVGGSMFFSAYVRSDGTISAIGQNSSGECNVPLPNEGFVEVDCGYNHSVGLKADGTLASWGWNHFGECNVPAPNEGFVGMAAGSYHSLGVKADGSVVAWGDNGFGQCNVPAPNTGFVAVAAGSSFSLGLKSNGTIVAWGAGSPPPGNSNFVAITAFKDNAAAIRADGSVVCMGDNAYGQCNVPAPNEGFVEVSCGSWHMVGLKADGTIVTWGHNYYGQQWIPQPNQDFGINQPAIIPGYGAASGGYEVVVNGSNLGDGTDVTAVSFAGIPVSEILSQSATQIVVRAAAAPGPLTGDVQIVSASYGVTVRTNGFTYVVRSGQTITFPPVPDQITTGRVVLAATASSGLPVSYRVDLGPAELAGSDLTFTAAGVVRIIASQAGNRNWEPAPEAAIEFVVNRAAASITLVGLSQTFDGTPRVVTVETVPAGLAADVLYNGFPAAPIRAGSHETTATIVDPLYEGGATGLLVVAKADASVFLDDLDQFYNGAVRSVSATTLPAGLRVDLAYEGGDRPVYAGTYGVTGTVNSYNYRGSATGTLTIRKAPQSIAFDAPADQMTPYITPLNAAASSGLPVSFSLVSGPAQLEAAVSPSRLTYAGAGEVVVAASQAGDAQWEPAATVIRTIMVSKAAATLSLSPLRQAFDGTPRAVHAATVPAGLTVDITYDGGTVPPIAPGSYMVTGMVSDAMYQQSVQNLLTVSKQAATVHLVGLEQPYDGTPRTVTATTMPAGLTVTFTYDGGNAAPVEGGRYFVVAEVADTYYSGSATGTLVVQAAGQTIAFPAIPAQETTNLVILAATASSGLPVHFDVLGGPAVLTGADRLTFLGAGEVVVGAYQSGAANWTAAPAVSNTFTVTKAAATVHLADLAQTYDGTARTASATTLPAGLAVEITYAGSAAAPVAAGTYAVTGTINDAMYQGAAAGSLVIGPAAAQVFLADLAQVYDGTARTASATTLPAGLVVEFTYAGDTNVPIDVGIYAVTGTVNDANWQGSATGTLVVGQAAATVFLADLAQVYDGTARTASATTLPAGLMVEFTYAGSSNAPIDVGTYAVTGTVNDANWQGTNTGTLVVGKGTATVWLGNLTQAYDGTARAASATTLPAGLTVEFTYDGATTAPSSAGSYAVTGSVNDANWQGTNSGTLVIGKAAATVNLESLLHTYDGTPKSATATTAPAGLAVEFTYDGAATAPSHAGRYAVTGTVNDADWAGQSSATLVIAKAAVTVVLGSLSHTYDGTPKSATATTVPTGLAVEFTYNGSAAVPVNPGSYAVTGTVNDATYQGSARGTLVIHPMAGDAYEADDTTGAAKAIGNGRTQNRNIHAAGNEDWAMFAVVGLGARNVQVETAGASGDTQMWLYNPAGAQIAYDNDNGTGSFSRITIASLVPGTYLIRVREYNNDGLIPVYTLRATWTPRPIPADAYEADDTSPFAKTIANGQTQNRTIHAAGKFDWAKFTVGRRGARNLVVETAGTSGDTQLWIYWPNKFGNAGLRMAYDDDGGVGKFSKITRLTLEPGTYYLKVQEGGNNSTIPAYLLRINWTTP